jgi:hypothetical protein
MIMTGDPYAGLHEGPRRAPRSIHFQPTPLDEAHQRACPLRSGEPGPTGDLRPV